MSDAWIDAGPTDALSPGDVMRFDLGEHTFAIYRDADDSLHATDGLCTHGKVHLADGFVAGSQIECPKHNGCFDFRSGQPKRKPVTVALRTYAVRSDGGRILLNPQPRG